MENLEKMIDVFKNPRSNLLLTDDTGKEIIKLLTQLLGTQLASKSSHGCICPVGAEKSCRGLACPRRVYRTFREA